MQTDPVPGRRRRRPAVSCTTCRRRKIRCNRETPCSNCSKSKDATCVYRHDVWSIPPQAPGSRQSEAGDAPALHHAPASGPSLPTPSTDAPSVSGPDRHGPSQMTPAASVRSADESTGDTRANGSHVASILSRPAPGTAPEPAASSAPSSANTPASTFTRSSRVETKTVHLAGNFHFHAEHRAGSQPQAVTRSVSHKTRYFGQSHWINTMVLLCDMFDVLERSLNTDASKTFKVENQCKVLARIIKRRRAPPWPCPLTPDLPPRHVADALVECYLSTSESVLRVLHIPSFLRDYEAVWNSDNVPDPAFLIQLKLVMAIGAPTYDSRFSLRPDATRWMYEAQTWISTPEFKSRLSIPSLQNYILLLIAREAIGIGADMAWANVGSILRIAMYMGLHRDPGGLGARGTNLLMAEMRRRLWNTILELAIQSSLNSGGPPLINLDDFDTEPPGNFDDDQLTEQPAPNPAGKPHNEFTQTTLAIALRSVLPQRLAVVKHLNDLSSCGTYAETLRLDAELREGYKALTRTLQACRTASRGPSESTLRAVDFLMRRYFLALHIPFFEPALQETCFEYSRRVTVESALRMWRTAFPTPLVESSDCQDAYDGPFARIAFSGSGFFRTAAIQGFVIIAAELSALFREEHSLGLQPVQLRPDLQLAMEEFKQWSWKCIEAGETSAKGYLMACLVDAHVEALRRGLNREEATALLVKSAEEAVERGLKHLQAVEAQTRPSEDDPTQDSRAPGPAGESDESYATPEFGIGGWDYMTSEVFLDTASQDPLSWVFP